MKRIVSLTLWVMMTSFLALNIQMVHAAQNDEPWRKYPDNSAATFKDPDSFYQSLDKKQYVEFENAKLTFEKKLILRISTPF